MEELWPEVGRGAAVAGVGCSPNSTRTCVAACRCRVCGSSRFSLVSKGCGFLVYASRGTVAGSKSCLRKLQQQKLPEYWMPRQAVRLEESMRVQGGGASRDGEEVGAV